MTDTAPSEWPYDLPAWRAAPRPAPADPTMDAKALATAEQIALMWAEDRTQFVAKIQVAVIDAMTWAPRPALGESEIRQAVARGWCYPLTANRIMDVDLVDAITRELMLLLGLPRPV
jgi:hypothetical protein